MLWWSSVLFLLFSVVSGSYGGVVGLIDNRCWSYGGVVGLIDNRSQ